MVASIPYIHTVSTAAHDFSSKGGVRRKGGVLVGIAIMTWHDALGISSASCAVWMNRITLFAVDRRQRMTKLHYSMTSVPSSRLHASLIPTTALAVP
jgi:hypothetical protein